MMKKMNRRDFIYWLPWLIPASAVVYIAIKDSRAATFNDGVTYGYISADNGGAFYKVYLDGEDVAWQAFEADDREGFVGIYEADADGNLAWPLRSRRIYGRVKIVPTTR